MASTDLGQEILVQFGCCGVPYGEIRDRGVRMRNVAGFFLLFALLGLSIASRAKREHSRSSLSGARSTLSLSDVLHSVHGTFQVESGGVDFGLECVLRCRGLIVVAAGSGKSGNDTRDRRMNKESILEAPQFATATFCVRNIGMARSPARETPPCRWMWSFHSSRYAA